jgi:hypothetical protein
MIEESAKGKRTLENRIVVIVFDSNGIVCGKEILLGENRIHINPHKTAENGYKTTILKEALSNIGKFGQGDLYKYK